MTKNFKVFLIGLGILACGVVLLIMIAKISNAQKYKSDLARVQKLKAELQVLRNENTRIEAERAGRQAVREYDMKHASPEQLRRMFEADQREMERLDAMIRVQQQRQ